MAHLSNKSRFGCQRSVRNLSARVPSRSRRYGKITIITIFALLGLLVMAGFIGNVGHITTNKIATQNAADSIAFSSAQWMARGMNAATATNHMLGEVTGLVVVIEGVAGPETYTSPPMEFYTTQNRTLDQVIRVLKDLAPAGNDTPGIYGEKAPVSYTHLTLPTNREV